MPQDLFITIKSHYNTFTRAEKHIADYVLASAKDVLYMTITELASACDVGDTSVFRFCRHLGKNGYQDFKVDLAQATSEMHALPQLKNCIVECADSTDVMIQKVLNNNIAVLKETYQLIDPATLMATARLLSKAGHICFFGVGASSASATEASNRFLRVCAKTECLQDARMQMMRAALMTKDDVAILFSYSGATKETVAIAQNAKAAGAHTVCISRFAHSPLAEICDLLFLCGGNEGPLQSGNMSVKSAQLLIMEVLYIAFCQENPQECERLCRITTDVLKRDKLT
jgi:DNA-binding MurR/RpiR family transcriptional regulator